jgi:DNA-binding transcriptional MocR family regulator
VLHALIFDFLNHRSGRLDPSYAAIAAKAGVCVRTVAAALKRLRELGILNWIRRCAESRTADGRFVLEQETNAYAVLPESQWRGYRPPPEPPAAPWPGTWGEPTPMPSALAQAALEGDLAGKVQALASDPKDGLAAALARLGQAFLARNA